MTLVIIILIHLHVCTIVIAVGIGGNIQHFLHSYYDGYYDVDTHNGLRMTGPSETEVGDWKRPQKYLMLYDDQLIVVSSIRSRRQELGSAK